MNKRFLLTLIMVFIISIAGCGGGGGDQSGVLSNATNNNANTSTLAADDPIANVGEVNDAIKSKSASWKAAENPVSSIVNSSSTSVSDLFGCSPETGTANAPGKAPVADNVTLPSSLDWRSKSGDFTTPAKNQGDFATCVAFSAVGALEAQEKIFTGQASLYPDYSELDLFYNGGGDFRRGWTISGAMRTLLNRGVVTETDAPYSYAPSYKLVNSNPKYKKITNFYAVTGKDAMKRALMSGPIAAALDVYRDFLYYSSGVYENVKGGNFGGHSVLIVGWDDSQNCWIARNSWGESWGQKGFFMIKYGQCGIDSYTAYGIDVDGTTSTSTTTTTDNNNNTNDNVIINPTNLLPPSSIETTLITDSEIDIKWAAVAGTIDGYNVYVNGRNYGRTRDTSCRIVHLNQNSTYEIELTSFRRRSESAKSQAVVVKTAATPVLQVPSSLEVTLVTTCEIGIKWNALSTSEIDGYRIYVNGFPYGRQTTNSFIVKNLHPNTVYKIKVSSYKGRNESEKSPEVQATTLNAPQKPYITRFRGYFSGDDVVMDFNLNDNDSSTVSVALKYSEDRGVTYKDAVSVDGDTGSVGIGQDKKIVWKIKNDVTAAKGILRFKIVLNDGYYTLDGVMGTIFLGR